MSKEITAELIELGPLNAEQQARVEAVMQARRALATRNPLTDVLPGGANTSHIGLITVAQWIIDGVDPWAVDNEFEVADRLDGDVIDIGPECFASPDESVVCWKGRNYVLRNGEDDVYTLTGDGVKTESAFAAQGTIDDPQVDKLVSSFLDDSSTGSYRSRSSDTREESNESGSESTDESIQADRSGMP